MCQSFRLCSMNPVNQEQLSDYQSVDILHTSVMSSMLCHVQRSSLTISSISSRSDTGMAAGPTRLHGWASTILTCQTVKLQINQWGGLTRASCSSMIKQRHRFPWSSEYLNTPGESNPTLERWHLPTPTPWQSWFPTSNHRFDLRYMLPSILRKLILIGWHT